MNELVKEVSALLQEVGTKLGREGKSITLQSAAAGSCILLARLKEHVTREEFIAACTLLAALLNSHATVKMLTEPSGRTVTETVESTASGRSAT